MVDIALFPIPECVAFPGTDFPLHVFEPRYRTMIKHCIENEMLLGVCHTEKILHQSKAHKSVEESLKSNQSTYKPQRVFSAGYCQLLETLDDGRMHINVHLCERFQAISEKQTLPFSIYKCEPYPDLEDDNSPASKLAQQKVVKRLSALAIEAPELHKLLSSPQWQKKSPKEFSFELFSLIRFHSEILQEILECQSALTRLDTILKILNQSNHE